MDMDFLSDPIFEDIGRSDFVGGIDNEALDFGHLEQFMQVAAAVGNLDDNLANGNVYSHIPNTNGKVDNQQQQQQPHHHQHPNGTHLPIATISARVSLTAASQPIATPTNGLLLATDGLQQTQQRTPQLPESPPDSSSEPPYSPLQDVHGLTLTSRELYNGLSGLHQPHDVGGSSLQQLGQFPTPNEPNAQTYYQHSGEPNLNLGQVRVKHEAGLLNNTNHLAVVHPNGVLNDTHIDMGSDGMHYPGPPNPHLMHYENVAANLYPTTTTTPTTTSYQNIGDSVPSTTVPTTTTTASCLITSMSEAARVQVIGTSPPTPILSRVSAPTTPIHSSSRKRKMSTQLDCADFAQIKQDPGLTLSPKRNTLNDKLTTSVSSPVNINLASMGPNDPSSTPTHSAASLSPALSTINSHADNSLDGGGTTASNCGEPADPNSLAPCIRFSPFQPQNWHKLCDQNLQELSVVYYRVDADKGFNFSVSDDAFVCQKKNHFQITCHARLQGDAKFVKTPSGLEKIKSFHLHFYGVKLEAPNQTIRVEQSQSDRSKKPFYPVPIDLQSHIVSKITVGRLHFSETTNNNMRKKGRPNPEQRYFQLVVGLHVHTMSGNFPVISQSSERIIVRASNPGQFESDVDLCWQRGLTQDSIFHMGRVGINTDRPDEGLVVHGNLKVSGHIVQPSDSRAKKEIGELDTSVQLRNLQKIRIVRYRYENEFAVHSGLKRASESDTDEIVDTGVIAQEVREVIPDAVKEAGSIVLPNGNVIENFLLVNKDRILMENIGAVKELCKVTGSLENRIENLERMNNRLIRAKELDARTGGRDCGGKEEAGLPGGYELCSNRTLQIIIFLLVIIMAACLAAVTTLYIIEHNKKVHKFRELEEFQVHLSNGHHFPQESILMSERKFLQSKFQFITTTTRPPQNNNTQPRQELNYSEGGDTFTSHGVNDELAVVMEQPVVLEKPLQALREPYRVTSTSPTPITIRNNKTISSKNKSKWPLPQEVLRAAAATQNAPQNETPHEEFDPNETNSNSSSKQDDSSSSISENSSEKAADAIPLPQDFENNSIDIDAQHITKKPPSVIVNKAGSPHRLVDGKLAESIVSTSSSNILTSLDNTVTVANSLKLINGGDSVIFKAVSPPSSNLTPQTTNRANGTPNTGAQLTYSVDIPPTSNKSQGVLESAIDNGDALDLQNLSSNNESSDNPFIELAGAASGRESTLGRRSTSQRSVEWVARRTIQVETFGAPSECSQKVRREEISNCQSMCFEDSNQLPILRVQPEERKHISVHEPQTVVLEEGDKEDDDDDVAVNKTKEDEEDDDDDAFDGSHLEKKPISTSTTANKIVTSIVVGKSAHTSSIAKQLSSEQQSSESLDDALETENLSGEHLSHKRPSQEPSISIEAPLSNDCWKISSCLVADNINKTLTVEDFCPNNGKSLNSTFIIPLSKYLKESNIELHLTSPSQLKWSVCHQPEEASPKQNSKHSLINSSHALSAPSPTSHLHTAISMPSNILQRRQNTSILFLKIPTRGYFERDISLRASNLADQGNACDEKAHVTNALLQYNFKILRDCD